MSSEKWIVCDDLTMIKIGDIGLFKTIPGVEGWSILAHYKPTGELLPYRTKLPNITVCQSILSYLMSLENPVGLEEEKPPETAEVEGEEGVVLDEDDLIIYDDEEAEEHPPEPSPLEKRRELTSEMVN